MKMPRRIVAVLISSAGLLSAQAGVVRYTGKVTVWQNPKVSIVFDVKSANGSTDQYRLVCGSPADAIRRGLRKDSVKQGDMLTVEVNEDRDSKKFGETIATLPRGAVVRDCELE